MRSHLFSGAISDEVVELLAVDTFFVKSALNGPPSSRVTGFLRYAFRPSLSMEWVQQFC